MEAHSSKSKKKQIKKTPVSARGTETLPDKKKGPTGEAGLTVGAGGTPPARRAAALEGFGELVTRAAVGAGMGSAGVLA